MKLTAKSFITHKKGETSAACHDAFRCNEESNRYAIADGATLSFFPQPWAELLVRQFCYPNGTVLSLAEENWEEWIEPIQQKWLQWVSQTVRKTNEYILVDRLAKLEPALSTFIGLEFKHDVEEWRALLLGDSCLFHRNERGFKSYPLETLADFAYRPKSFASFPKDNPVGGPPEVITGKAAPGDLFILTTDALAKWIVQHHESEKLVDALSRLEQIETAEQFHEFVDWAREAEDIRLVNDDVTLVLISVEESPLQEDKGLEPEPRPESHTAAEEQPESNILRILFWGLLAGIFGFGFGFLLGILILLWRFKN